MEEGRNVDHKQASNISDGWVQNSICDVEQRTECFFSVPFSISQQVCLSLFFVLCGCVCLFVHRYVNHKGVGRSSLLLAHWNNNKNFRFLILKLVNMPTRETDTNEFVPLHADEEEGGGAAATIELPALRVGNSAEYSFVELRAPSDLPPHYEVAVELSDGRRTTVVVPEEGARRGQIFRALLVGESAGENNNNRNNRREITGRWRVSLFELSESCLFALFCFKCMVGRIMERTKLNVCADSRSSDSQDLDCFGPFKVLIIVALVDFGVSSYTAHAQEMVPLLWVVRCVESLYLWYVIARTRRHIRRARQIGGDDFDDCFLACFCGVCTVAQMDQETFLLP